LDVDAFDEIAFELGHRVQGFRPFRLLLLHQDVRHSLTQLFLIQLKTIWDGAKASQIFQWFKIPKFLNKVAAQMIK
jgi:hypothetical protein